MLDPAAHGITTANWPRLSLTTAVAICDALAPELNPQSEIRKLESTSLAIKWPNDVILNDRKVCGILIESPGGAAPAKDRVIIGIGININNSWRHGYPEAIKTGIAICDVTSAKHSLANVLVAAVRAFERRLVELADDSSRLARVWQQLCWLKGEQVSVDRGDCAIGGRCSGIADDGALVLETRDTAERFYSGSLSANNSAPAID